MDYQSIHVHPSISAPASVGAFLFMKSTSVVSVNCDLLEMKGQTNAFPTKDVTTVRDYSIHHKIIADRTLVIDVTVG